MLFDMHVHIFPDKLAPKALHNLSQICKSPYYADGTAAGTERQLKEWGVTGAAVMHIATKPSQQKTVNDWAASVQGEFYHCFGTIHPDAPDALEEVERIRKLGLYGIKLHPDYQGFCIDEQRMFPIYDAAAALGLPILFHTGWDPLSPDKVHAPSEAVARMVKQFPKLTVIGAHMGGMNRYDEVEEFLAGTDLYIDTAMSSHYCSPEQFARLIKKHGADRVLFGSDCPWSRSCDELRFLEEAPLTDGEREKIYYRNAMRLLGLKD